MALSRKQMYDCYIKRCEKIQQMFNNSDIDDRHIFEELCCSIFSGDEYEYKNELKNVPGIINNDVSSLLDALCHIIVAEYAINSVIDNQSIDMPDHSEILATICAQLKRDGVSLQYVYECINKTDTFNWFVTNYNELSIVQSGIKDIWEHA